MIRTQICVPKQLYREIQVLADQQNRPAAEVVRALLRDALTRQRAGHTVGQALTKLAAIHASGPVDLSEHLDDYLYDDAA